MDGGQTGQEGGLAEVIQAPMEARYLFQSKGLQADEIYNYIYVLKKKHCSQPNFSSIFDIILYGKVGTEYNCAIPWKHCTGQMNNYFNHVGPGHIEQNRMVGLSF